MVYDNCRLMLENIGICSFMTDLHTKSRKAALSWSNLAVLRSLLVFSCGDFDALAFIWSLPRFVLGGNTNFDDLPRFEQ